MGGHSRPVGRLDVNEPQRHWKQVGDGLTLVGVSHGSNDVLHVLIVDDQALFSQGSAALLTMLYPRAVVQEASSSAEAIVLLRRKAFDIVMIDIGLKEGRDGLELLQDLRGMDGPNNDVPVLIVSGRDDKQNVQAAYRYGANGFLSKNLTDGEQFREAIAQVVCGGTYMPAAAAKAFTSDYDEGQWDRYKLLAEIQSWPQSRRDIALWRYWGLQDKVVVKNTGLSESAIRKTADRIYKCLGVANRAQFMVLLGDHAIKQQVFWRDGQTPRPPADSWSQLER